MAGSCSMAWSTMGVAGRARADGVDPYALGPVVEGGHLGQSDDAVLRCGVGRLAGIADQAHPRCRVDDGAPSPLEHAGDLGFHAQIDAGQHHGHGAVPTVVGIVGQGSHRRSDPGVVVGAVEAPVGVDRVLHHGGHVRWHAHVGADETGPPAGRLHQGHRLPSPVFVDVGDHDAGTLPGEDQCRCPPDPHGGTGDNGDLPVQRAHRRHATGNPMPSSYLSTAWDDSMAGWLWSPAQPAASALPCRTGWPTKEPPWSAATSSHIAGGIVCDVSDAASCAAAVASVLGDHGRLDVLANVAGIGISRTIHDLTPTSGGTHRSQPDRHLPACRRARSRPCWRPRGDRQHGIGGRPAGHAVQRRVLRLQRRRHHADQVDGHRAGQGRGPGQCRLPGFGRHPVPPELPAARGGRHGPSDPVRRPPWAASIDPAEVAAAVAYLASDDAATISGTTLVIDGAATA